MVEVRLLQANWKDQLADLLRSAKADILISSPYVTQEGTEFVLSNLSSQFHAHGRLTFLTDLSPMNICQGATDPKALHLLASSVPNYTTWHLPRLHAKVYVADNSRAIISSGNLTTGGLSLNYEYGAELSIPLIVETIRDDISAYASLGARVTAEQLVTYCQVAAKVQIAFRKQQAGASGAIRREFEQALRSAEDELIRLRLAEGPIHTVFAKTIYYLLHQRGPLTTHQLENMIEAIHPDLCDNNVDRVIDGKSFGKKWKHAVRTAISNSQKRALIGQGGDRGGLWVAITTKTLH